ncbi:hypothetical protein GLOIN_2v1761741 [Rhizophagus clarus]|uniref:HAT C-terminal dimerisation domain-containing protein n=1 Tax=Rhizophagus clarus TaxID=94130 RepID=A0A8H3QEF2_9GLOM|nr:hypothetical protein GLOIN_2v1761741 [Rhizophagus clarus]
MHGILSPCKIPLYNKIRWNSWFWMVSYTKDHIIYWPSFFKAELDNDKKHNTLAIINSCLQNEQELGLIIIYLNFISFYASEFIQCLDFFQKIKKPVILFAELRLQQLTAYIETYRNSNDFVKEFENPSDELLREWKIYCGLNNELIGEVKLDKYWLNKATQLPILSNLALDYIWLPISSCTVERSFSMYNSLLDSDRQNLSLDSLKRLSMLYFNGV